MLAAQAVPQTQATPGTLTTTAEDREHALTEIRASTVLPARREAIKLLTSDGLDLVGELALPAGRDPVATLICLVTSQVISYIKARAEASGLRGDGGLIERPERLIIVLVGAGVSDFPAVSWPPALPVAMWLLAVASLVTCAQRLHRVRTSPGARDPMDRLAGTGEP